MNLQQLKYVYFLGIGGIGMSAIARWFIANGYQLAGYDKTATPLTQALEKEGAKVHFEDSIELIPSEYLADTSQTLVVYTPAIPKNHTELNYFQENGFTLMKRSQVLGLLTQNMFTIGVAGTHGKTTTSSMIAHILKNAKVDSLEISIEKALWNKDLTGEIEPFANLDHLLEQLPTLPTREYSIASIPSQQVLRLVVRQQHDESGNLGLGSGWLTQHTQVNDDVALRIRTNESFHLIDDNRPIICIGNGTGIAGLMSLLHTRTRHDYTENWLIFGERQRACDFFYESTIEAWKTTGMLKRLDLAFSRDQEQRMYVQDVIRQNAAELVSWVERGAVLYVCGSIDGMASGVDQALIEILGEEQVDDLRQQGRYRRDVY